MTDHSADHEGLLRDLISAHGGVVRLVVSRFEHDPSEAEEIWSDVFQLAYERIDQVSTLPSSQQRSWLLRTSRFIVANRGRRRAVRRRTVDRLRREPLPFSPSAEDEYSVMVETHDLLRHSEQVREALSHLRFEHRQILVLHALGNNGPAIARQLGISPEAVRKRLMVARNEFRKLHPGTVEVPAEGGAS